MCGIAGYFLNQAPSDPILLSRMGESLAHRGPDDAGAYEAGPVGLAMRRLKVIDLETGNQPMQDPSGRFHLVFNGEIYNYREIRQELENLGESFRTQSDTEVLLKILIREGVSGLQKLNGMFALALYDRKENSVFLARDRLGIKPLFYTRTSAGWYFASEMKALMHAPQLELHVDPQAISHYFSLNYLPPPWTPFKGIHQLKPGHTLTLSKGEVKEIAFWDLPQDDVLDDDESSILKRVDELLHKSVERRLVADVPVGAFLSGGLDSSTLVALMKEHREDKIKTFSVGFDYKSYDESHYAMRVARHFDTDHYHITLHAEDVLKALPQVHYFADNPLADQAAMALYQVAKLAKEHVTVALSGDGGDEVFLGYRTLLANHYHQIYKRVPKFFRNLILEPGIRRLSPSVHKLSWEYQLKKFIQAAEFSPDQAHYSWRTVFTAQEKENLFIPPVWEEIAEKDAYGLYQSHFQRKGGDLDRNLYADLKVWLVGNNLCKVDSMTMAHGLEARVPFLDHELVEYLARVPKNIKFKNRTLKYLQKKVMQGRLPKSILARKKAGWHIPISVWMQEQLFEHTQSTLAQMPNLLKPYLDTETPLRLLQEHLHGRGNHTFKLWGLLSLFHWAQQIEQPKTVLAHEN